VLINSEALRWFVHGSVHSLVGHILCPLFLVGDAGCFYHDQNLWHDTETLVTRLLIDRLNCGRGHAETCHSQSLRLNDIAVERRKHLRRDLFQRCAERSCQGDFVEFACCQSLFHVPISKRFSELRFQFASLLKIPARLKQLLLNSHAIQLI
jgi:hypothetical protein